MKQVNLKWFDENPTSRLYFVTDSKGNKLFNIYIEVERKIHSSVESTDINDNIYEVTFGDVQISSIMNPVNLMKYHKSIYNDILLNNINEDLFFDYINKFDNISVWNNCTYKPKWEKILGDEYFDSVIKYIENDLYLFTCSFDGTVAYENTVQDNKRYIKK